MMQLSSLVERSRFDRLPRPARIGLAALAAIVGLQIVFRPVPPSGVFLNGAIVGSLYGLMAMGLILIYKADRIISFAQAGLGAFPAVLALNLYLQRDWPYLVCLVMALVGAVGIGVLCHRLVIVRFVDAPRLILTVATIGLSQVLAFAEFMSPTWIGGEVTPTGAVPTPFSSTRREVGGVIFRGDHLAAVVVVVAAAAALLLMLGRSRIGVAIRAVAENRDRAKLAAVPVRRVGTIVWGVAGLLSGIGVFFRAPVAGLPLGSLIGPQVLLFALAAAVIARMDRFDVALVAGALLGVFDQVSFYVNRTASVSTALLLPIVLIALVAQRRDLSRAHAGGEGTWQMVKPIRGIPPVAARLPEVRVARIVGPALLVVVALGAPFVVDELRRNDLSQVLLFGVISVSLVVLTGWTGQISLGQFALTGVGAAVAGGLAGKAEADFLVAVLLGGLAGALISMIIGIPALRVRGLFLALATLAFAASAQAYLLNREYFSWLLPDIGNRIDRPHLWGVVDVTGDVAFYYVCLMVLAGAVVFALNLRRSRSGRAFLATRDNERAAQAYGISLARTRLGAFAISGFMAGIAGALYTYLYEAVDPDSFGVQRSIDVFAMAVIGGLGSIGGAIAGAVYVVGVREFLPRYELLATGAGLLVLLMFLPGGLAEVGARIRDLLVRLAARRHDIDERALKWGEDLAIDDGIGAAVVRESHGAVGTDDTLLRCRSVDAGYGRVQVLFGVDVHVNRGEVVALLGTNGAGKSTLVRTIAGLQPAVGGSIEHDGTDISSLDAGPIAERGIAYMPGGRGVFPTLTVMENLRVAAWSLPSEQVDAEIEEVLQAFPRLRERKDTMAGEMSGGEQQMLSLGMAFCLKPTLLIIDELSLGLAPVIVGDLVQMVRQLNERGTTILIVEQSIKLALTMADRAYFMEKGQVRFSGPTADLLDRDDLVRAVMLAGSKEDEEASSTQSDDPTIVLDETDGTAARPTEPQPTGPRLVIAETKKTFGGIVAVAGTSLHVDAGEILGIIGPNGAGKTTTFDLVSGFLAPDSGTIELDGVDITRQSPHLRARAGLGRMFQDSLLFPSMTVAENLAVAFERHFPLHDDVAAMLGLPAARRAEIDVAWSVADLLEMFDLSLVERVLAGELSTGTRRVVDLAMAVAHQPSVLLLDEPSSGLAQRETEALAAMIRRIQSETGASLLVIEHDMSLITEISDRMVALEVGVVIAEGTPDEVVSDPRVVASYLGDDAASIHRSDAGSSSNRSNGHNRGGAPRRRSVPVEASRTTTGASS